MSEMELPSNWSSSTLEELLDFVVGGDWGKEPEFPDDDYVEVRCIRGSEFKNWKTNKGKTASIRKIKKSSLETRRLCYGDVLVEISGGGPDQPVGRTVLIDDDCIAHYKEFDKVCTNFLRLVRPSRHINSSYLNYYLQSFYNSGEVTNYQGGSNNLRNLKFKEYVSISIPVAPLNEQIRIADKLDSVLAKVDAAQARLEKIPTLLKRFRQSVLAAATSGELTETEPTGQDSIGNVCEVIGGLTKNKQRDSFPQQLPYLRVANVYENDLKLEDISKIGVSDKELERILLKKDDLLVVEGNGSLDQIGRVALWDDSISPCVHQNHLIKVRISSEKLLPKYLLYYLMSPKGKYEIVGKATSGAGLYTLSISKISSINVVMFNTDQQSEIVRRVESLFTLADTVEKQYLAAKQRLDRLTQSLLAKAFRGELVPQDPSDEPAAELLKRIQAERNAQPPVKNKRAKSA